MNEKVELLDGNLQQLRPQRWLSPWQVDRLLSRGLVQQVGNKSEYSQVFFRGSLAAINAALRAGVRKSVPRAEDCTTTCDGENGTKHKWPMKWHPWHRALIGPGRGPRRDDS